MTFLDDDDDDDEDRRKGSVKQKLLQFLGCVVHTVYACRRQCVMNVLFQHGWSLE